MKKQIKLHYNLIHFDIYSDKVKTKTSVSVKKVLHEVATLLDLELDYKIDGTEVYTDKTDELMFVNIIFKTKAQTITIQIIPNVYIRDDNNTEKEVINNRKILIQSELMHYANTLLNVFIKPDNIDDILSDKYTEAISSYITIEHWNQIPIKFE